MTLLERRELEELLSADPYDKLISGLADELFNTPYNQCENTSPAQVTRSLKRLHKKIEHPGAGNNVVRMPLVYLWRKLAAVAAMLIFILGVGFYLLQKQDLPAVSENIVSTKRGSKSSIVLPDGTKVWINSATKLTYGKSFGGQTREVSLEGEAYFDVVKNESCPFIVHTQTLDVKVLGTAFNVRAYHNEAHTEATLVRGSVEVLLKKKNNETITLQPNEKIVVQNPNRKTDSSRAAAVTLPEIVLQKVAFNPVDSGILETQWIKNSIRFDQDKLEDIIPMLESWYNVKITVTAPSLRQRRFSGTIEDESLGEVLESFSLASGLRYKIEKENVTIYK